MPETFDIIAALPTLDLNESNRLVQMIEATGVTKPHGVEFTVSVQKTPGWKDRLMALAASEAAELESIFDA